MKGGDNARVAAVARLQEALGHAFADLALLERALTHASAGEGARKVADNERLEFLGDRVLGLIIAEALAGRMPGEHEGGLSKRLAVLVTRATCARVARRVGVGPALRLAGGETRRGAREQDAFLGDACEALIAALYLDGGLEAARAVVLRLWAPEFEAVEADGFQDPKTALQEWASAHRRPPPAYSVLSREGPDHAPLYTVQVAVEGLAPVSANGSSRQAAEKTAAAELLALAGS